MLATGEAAEALARLARITARSPACCSIPNSITVKSGQIALQEKPDVGNMLRGKNPWKNVFCGNISCLEGVVE